jgi:hypothetical protein
MRCGRWNLGLEFWVFGPKIPIGGERSKEVRFGGRCSLFPRILIALLPSVTLPPERSTTLLHEPSARRAVRESRTRGELRRNGQDLAGDGASFPKNQLDFASLFL